MNLLMLGFEEILDEDKESITYYLVREELGDGELGKVLAWTDRETCLKWKDENLDNRCFDYRVVETYIKEDEIPKWIKVIKC